MAELADAPDLGSGGNPVQVQVLLPALSIMAFHEVSWRAIFCVIPEGPVDNYFCKGAISTDYYGHLYDLGHLGL